MSFRRIIILAATFICSFLQPVTAQEQRPHTGILFYQLNTSHGLSDNYIFDMCFDKSGNLWVASGEGLNMFNGKTVTRFFQQEYPALRTDFMRQVISDEDNRIWVLGAGGLLTLVDENRKFHKVIFRDTAELPIHRVLKTRNRGIILFAGTHFYTLAKGSNPSKSDSLLLRDFTRLPVEGLDPVYANHFIQAEPYDEESYILTTAAKIALVSFRTGKVTKEFPYSNLNILARWSPGVLLVYERIKAKVYTLDLSNGHLSLPFDTIRDQHGRSFTARINKALLVNDDDLWMTSTSQGLFHYKRSTGTLYNFRHNAADPNTIINNSPSVLALDASGWIFIANTPNGISYFKTNAVIGQQAVFTDTRGNGYDGYINTIATLDNDHFYIGISDNLLLWKRSTNTTQFLAHESNDKAEMMANGVNYIAFDGQKRLWAAVPTVGIFILGRDHRVIKLLRYDSLPASGLPSNYIRHMGLDPTGENMWLSTRKGICRVNTVTLEVDRLKDLPFRELEKLYCNRTWFYDPDNLWIGSEGVGAWHYTFSTKKLEKITTENGGLSNTVFCFNKDRPGNLYIGTPEGLQIRLRDGKTKAITMQDGLLHNRVEALLLDKKDRIWMGNDVGLSCYRNADNTLRVFDERYGLSVQGFRINAYHQGSDDELVWGTERGLQYFYPDSLWDQQISLSTTIHRLESRDIIANMTHDAVFDLSPNDNSVTFYFSAIDFSKHLRTFYEYKLEGVDPNWVKVVDQNFVRYSSLPAGDYVFRVRASNDNKVWEEARNSVRIRIAYPVWQTTWFKLLGAFIVSIIFWLVFRYYRNKQHRQREELETEAVINYFASQINAQRKTEDILWDVAKNCISKLGFEDCVIYLVDEERKMLVQKAAYGPKMERDFTIYQPIEIPLGKGIVGTVAITGKAELVPNTELDKRYIADDARRFSEVAVPLVVDNKVIGVIDSEHSKRNFFTQKHLNILSTIAVLSANQIQRARAEEEKQQARIEVLENKQKVTESRLQSLRLQMNPHFLFNALNSIQQMILANEELVATRYLSRFSKLLRTILVHSDKEEVSLKEELEILHLYVELESVRFKDSFSYQIECDEEIDTDEVKVPTLLVQPFVENAIWHGLMHKEGLRKLKIRFYEDEEHLHCVIEDNGIGRKKSREAKMAAGQGQKHISKGIQVSLERLKAMDNGNGETGSLEIIDLVNEKGEAQGTRIEISFPIQT